MPLILRSVKGTKLSILEMDGNFTYLEQLALGSSQSIIPAGGTAGQVLAKASDADYDLVWTDQTGGGTGDGTSGTSGVSGTNGSSGTSGISGSNGSSGTSGADGTSGTSGADGSSGTSGLSISYTSTIGGTVNYVTGAQGVFTGTGLSFVAGDYIRISAIAATGPHTIFATVGEYNISTGYLGFDTVYVEGDQGNVGGSHSLNLSGRPGDAGANGTSGTSGTDGVPGNTAPILGIYTDYSSLTQSVGNADTVPTPGNLDAYLVVDTAHVWIFSTSSNAANAEGWVDMGAIAGPQGLPGEAGSSGTSGESGTSGTSGAAGESGSSGTSGATGESGTSGTSGISASLSVRDSIYDYDSTPAGIFDLADAQYSKTTYWSRTSGDLLNIDTVGQFGYLTQSSTTAPLADNESYEVPFYSITGEFVQFLGSTYSSFWVNSNSYITFGASSSASAAMSPGQVSAPALFIGAGDNSINKLVYGFDDPVVSGPGLTANAGTEDLFRVRFVGNHDSNGSSTTNSLQWELQIYKNSPMFMSLIVEAAPATSLTYRSPGGVWGISDGSRWVERLSGLPTFDENLNGVWNTAIIYSDQTSSVADTIKFVGPGVYKYSSGSLATINIDPLGQYGIGVNFDTYSSAATAQASVISATKYDLRLTTGRDGSAIRMRPRGKAIIAPYNRLPNQPGAGYGVDIIASNAAASPTQSNYDGGSLVLRPGSPSGTGATGSIYIGLPSSSNILLGKSYIDAVYSTDSIYVYDIAVDTYVPGFTGTFQTGDSRTATVVGGIITDVS